MSTYDIHECLGDKRTKLVKRVKGTSEDLDAELHAIHVADPNGKYFAEMIPIIEKAPEAPKSRAKKD